MLLSFMREGSKSVFAKALFSILLASAVGGLVFMDAGGFFRGGRVGMDEVARMGIRNISAAEFDGTVRQVLSRQSLDPKLAYNLGLIDQILDSQINTELTYRAAHDLGLRMDSDLIVTRINKLIEPLITPEMSRKEAMKRILMNQGMSEGQFIQAVKTETSNAILGNALQSSSTFMPDAEAQDLYEHMNEKRTVSFIVLPNSAVKDYQDPKDEVLLPFYQAGKEKYAIPETRSFSLAVLSPDEIKKTLNISEEQIRQTYDKDVESYQTPEQRVMEQAILPAQDQADQVKAKLAGGVSLKDAVKSVTGKTDAYIGENKFQKDGLDKNIAVQAFAVEKGESVGPVQTSLGWHVMVVKNIIAPAVKPYESVKEEIRRDLMQSQASDQLYAVSGEIDDKLAGGSSLEDVAKSMNMSLKSFGPVRADGSTAESKEGVKDIKSADRKKILESGFSLGEGETSPVFELADGSFAALRVNTIQEKSYVSFDKVKEDLRKVWIADQQDVINGDRTKEALRQIQNHEKSLADVASSFQVQVQNTVLSRNADSSAPFAGRAKEAFFNAQQGSYTLAAGDKAFIIGTVTKVDLPDTDKVSASQINTLKDAQAPKTGEDFVVAFMDFLRVKNHVKVNKPLLEQMYGGASKATGQP